MDKIRPLADMKALFRRSPAFRQVFLADLACQFGDGGLTVAFPLLILDRTHDVALTGLAFSGEILAFALVSPFAGYLADKFEQKTVMIGANIARVFIMGILLAGALLKLPMAAMLILSVALGAVGAFFVPARSAFQVRLLEGEDLEKAIALEWSSGFLMRLISPPLMGLLLAVMPAATGLAVDMAFYLLASALLLPRIVRPTLDAPVSETGELPGGFMEGYRIIRGSPELRGLLSLDATISLLAMAGFASTVALLDQELRVGAQANGWLMATTGLAGALGAQLAGSIGRYPCAYPALAGAIGLSYVLVPHAGSLPVLMAMWALRGLAIGALGVLISRRLATSVPKEAMGRVNAAWILAACLAAFAGTVATPFLLRTIGAGGSFRLYGVMMLTAALLMVLTRTLRAIQGRKRPTDSLEAVAKAVP
jgi:MFS family permease